MVIKPIQWIIIAWSIGTVITYLVIMHKWEESPTGKKILEREGKFFDPQFVRKVVYIMAVPAVFLSWPFMPIIWLWEKFKLWVACLVISRIVYLSNNGNDQKKIKRLFKIVNLIYSKKDGDE